jgi:hemoglobin
LYAPNFGQLLNFTLEHTPYKALGGEANVRHLVDAFYDRMDLEPAFKVIRELHPADLSHSRDKFYKFMSGWLGGPQLYTAEYGHPQLRMRHMPFAIDSSARDQWMACMQIALDDCKVAAEMQTWLLAQLFKTADWMRNKPG